MTLQELVSWVLSQGKVAKYNDGQYMGECVSLINQYCYRVLNVPAGAWGDAADWATNANVLRYFDALHETTTLEAGDVLVYPRPKFGSTGHIELYIGGGRSLEQNRNYDHRAHERATLAGYTTVLRPKGGVDVKINDTDNEYARWRKLGQQVRGRDLTREEFRKSAVGLTWLRAIEVLSDSKEADQNLADAALGKVARRDKWQEQIETLAAQLKAARQGDADKKLSALKGALKDVLETK